MSKKNEKTDRSKSAQGVTEPEERVQSAEKTTASRERQRLEQYLTELLPELNLRLLLDMEPQEQEEPNTEPFRNRITVPSESVLWVSGITVTAYESASGKAGRRRIWSRLSSLWENSRTRKKEKRKKVIVWQLQNNLQG